MAETTTSSEGPVPPPRRNTPTTQSKLRQVAERLRLETAHLRDRLRSENDAVRTLRAQHAAELRSERSAARQRRTELETQLNGMKSGAGSTNSVNSALKCEQCCRLKSEFDAELKKEKSEFKKREEMLKLQLNNVPALSNNKCEDCFKISAEYNTMIHKEQNEFKKKEELLCKQLKEKDKEIFKLYSTSTSNSNTTINCDQCSKTKLQLEIDLKSERIEYKKKEYLLKQQLKEKEKLISSYNNSNTSENQKNNCEYQCLKIKQDLESQLKRDRDEFKKKEEMLKQQLKEKELLNVSNNVVNDCKQCLKIKIEYDAQLKKELNEFKHKEDLLKQQLKERINSTSNDVTKQNCDQCSKVKIEYDAEMKKERNEFKKKEDMLKEQLKEKENFTSSAVTSQPNCEQCIKTKHEFEAEIKKEKSESLKKEELLKQQLKQKENISTTNSSQQNCDQCVRTKSEYDAELKKERNEFKKKEDNYKQQLKDKLAFNNTATLSNKNCDQCAKIKAEFGANVRQEKAEFKKREFNLKTQLKDLKKFVGGSSPQGGGCSHCVKSSKDIGRLREDIRILEEKLQKVTEADRLKATDLRTQHEEHLAEISKIIRVNKSGAYKLLEELKTKDKIIAQLRSGSRIRANSQEKEYGSSDNAQMRKLREEARKNEQPALVVACDLKPNIESHEKFLQNEILDRNLTNKNKEQMVCGGPTEDLEPSMEEDTDSAVSSAPSSLSPQPCSPLNDDCPPLRIKSSGGGVSSGPLSHRHHGTLTISGSPPPASLSPQLSEGYTTPPPGLWLIADEDLGDDIREGHIANSELTMARQQVRELERALLVTRASKPSNRHIAILEDRVRQLEEREAALLRELSDLREQNELLEFRVLELAECADKASITALNVFPDLKDVSDVYFLRETKEVATNTIEDEKEQIASMDQLNDEPIRQGLIKILKQSPEEEDQKCLLQVLVLLHGLEELRRLKYNPFTNVELIEDNQEYADMNSLNSLTGGSTQITRTNRCPDRDRLVAKVPPFTGRTAESDDDRESVSPPRSKEFTSSCGTQTDASSEVTVKEPVTSLNLTAEVKKLDKLRETIEVVGNKHGRLVSTCCCDQKSIRQLEFYRERVEVLERKVLIYESSGELQIKQLSDRLNREVRLEAQVKYLNITLQKLQQDNSRLEEERCELEEAENDTRLRCQRLESDLIQLERSRMSAKRRSREARSQSTYWESMVSKYEERNYELEERAMELRHRLDLLEKTAPQILFLNMWKMMQQDPQLDVISQMMKSLKGSTNRSRSTSCDRSKSKSRKRNKSKNRSKSRSKSRSPHRSRSPQGDNIERGPCSPCVKPGITSLPLESKVSQLEDELTTLLEQKKDMEKIVKDLEAQLQARNNDTPYCGCGNDSTLDSSGLSETPQPSSSISSADLQLIIVVQELKEKENEMKRRIDELEKREAAYMETLQQADEIWAEMESGYKKKISEAELNETVLKDKLKRMEKCRSQPLCPSPEIGELEESERELLNQADRLAKDNTRLTSDNKRLEMELHSLRDELFIRKADLVSNEQLSKELNRQRKKSEDLEFRLEEENAALQEADSLHCLEIDSLKVKLSRTTNELVHLEVTNGELREEVDTLESKIAELERTMRGKSAADETVIKGLTCELNDRDKELATMKQKDAACVAGERLGVALQGVKNCEVCSKTISPDLVETVEGVRTLCELVSCPVARPPPDDTQVRKHQHICSVRKLPRSTSCLKTPYPATSTPKQNITSAYEARPISPPKTSPQAVKFLNRIPGRVPSDLLVPCEPLCSNAQRPTSASSKTCSTISNISSVSCLSSCPLSAKSSKFICTSSTDSSSTSSIVPSLELSGSTGFISCGSPRRVDSEKSVPPSIGCTGMNPPDDGPKPHWDICPTSGENVTQSHPCPAACPEPCNVRSISQLNTPNKTVEADAEYEPRSTAISKEEIPTAKHWDVCPTTEQENNKTPCKPECPAPCNKAGVGDNTTNKNSPFITVSNPKETLYTTKWETCPTTGEVVSKGPCQPHCPAPCNYRNAAPTTESKSLAVSNTCPGKTPVCSVTCMKPCNKTQSQNPRGASPENPPVCTETCSNPCNKTKKIEPAGTCPGKMPVCTATCSKPCNKTQSKEPAGICPGKTPVCTATCSNPCNKTVSIEPAGTCPGKTPVCTATCSNPCNKTQNIEPAGTCPGKMPVCTATCSNPCNKTQSMEPVGICPGKTPVCTATCTNPCNKTPTIEPAEICPKKTPICTATCRNLCNKTQNIEPAGTCPGKMPVCTVTCSNPCNKTQSKEPAGICPGKTPVCTATCSNPCNKTVSIEPAGTCPGKTPVCTATCSNPCNKTQNIEPAGTCPGKMPVCTATCSNPCNETQRMEPAGICPGKTPVCTATCTNPCNKTQKIEPAGTCPGKTPVCTATCSNPCNKTQSMEPAGICPGKTPVCTATCSNPCNKTHRIEPAGSYPAHASVCKPTCSGPCNKIQTSVKSEPSSKTASVCKPTCSNPCSKTQTKVSSELSSKTTSICKPTCSSPCNKSQIIQPPSTLTSLPTTSGPSTASTLSGIFCRQDCPGAAHTGDIVAILPEKGIVCSCGTSKSPSMDLEQYDLLTEVAVAGQPPFGEIRAMVDLQPEIEAEEFKVNASVTDSGNLNVTTKGPQGLVQHTMVYTPSGNMELETQFFPMSETLDIQNYFHEKPNPAAPDRTHRIVSVLPVGRVLRSAVATKKLEKLYHAKSMAESGNSSLVEFINPIKHSVPFIHTIEYIYGTQSFVETEIQTDRISDIVEKTVCCPKFCWICQKVYEKLKLKFADYDLAESGEKPMNVEKETIDNKSEADSQCDLDTCPGCNKGYLKNHELIDYVEFENKIDNKVEHKQKETPNNKLEADAQPNLDTYCPDCKKPHPEDLELIENFNLQKEIEVKQKHIEEETFNNKSEADSQHDLDKYCPGCKKDNLQNLELIHDVNLQKEIEDKLEHKREETPNNKSKADCQPNLDNYCPGCKNAYAENLEVVDIEKEIEDKHIQKRFQVIDESVTTEQPTEQIPKKCSLSSELLDYTAKDNTQPPPEPILSTYEGEGCYAACCAVCGIVDSNSSKEKEQEIKVASEPHTEHSLSTYEGKGCYTECCAVCGVVESDASISHQSLEKQPKESMKRHKHKKYKMKSSDKTSSPEPAKPLKTIKHLEISKTSVENVKNPSNEFGEQLQTIQPIVDSHLSSEIVKENMLQTQEIDLDDHVRGRSSYPDEVIHLEKPLSEKQEKSDTDKLLEQPLNLIDSRRFIEKLEENSIPVAGDVLYKSIQENIKLLKHLEKELPSISSQDSSANLENNNIPANIVDDFNKNIPFTEKVPSIINSENSSENFEEINVPVHDNASDDSKKIIPFREKVRLSIIKERAELAEHLQGIIALTDSQDLAENENVSQGKGTPRRSHPDAIEQFHTRFSWAEDPDSSRAPRASILSQLLRDRLPIINSHLAVQVLEDKDVPEARNIDDNKHVSFKQDHQTSVESYTPVDTDDEIDPERVRFEQPSYINETKQIQQRFSQTESHVSEDNPSDYIELVRECLPSINDEILAGPLKETIIPQQEDNSSSNSIHVSSVSLNDSEEKEELKPINKRQVEDIDPKIHENWRDHFDTKMEQLYQNLELGTPIEEPQKEEEEESVLINLEEEEIRNFPLTLSINGSEGKEEPGSIMFRDGTLPSIISSYTSADKLLSSMDSISHILQGSPNDIYNDQPKEELSLQERMTNMASISSLNKYTVRDRGNSRSRGSLKHINAFLDSEAFDEGSLISFAEVHVSSGEFKEDVKNGSIILHSGSFILSPEIDSLTSVDSEEVSIGDREMYRSIPSKKCLNEKDENFDDASITALDEVQVYSDNLNNDPIYSQEKQITKSPRSLEASAIPQSDIVLLIPSLEEIKLGTESFEFVPDFEKIAPADLDKNRFGSLDTNSLLSENDSYIHEPFVVLPDVDKSPAEILGDAKSNTSQNTMPRSSSKASCQIVSFLRGLSNADADEIEDFSKHDIETNPVEGCDSVKIIGVEDATSAVASRRIRFAGSIVEEADRRQGYINRMSVDEGPMGSTSEASMKKKSAIEFFASEMTEEEEAKEKEKQKNEKGRQTIEFYYNEEADALEAKAKGDEGTIQKPKITEASTTYLNESEKRNSSDILFSLGEKSTESSYCEDTESVSSIDYTVPSASVIFKRGIGSTSSVGDDTTTIHSYEDKKFRQSLVNSLRFTPEMLAAESGTTVPQSVPSDESVSLVKSYTATIHSDEPINFFEMASDENLSSADITINLFESKEMKIRPASVASIAESNRRRSSNAVEIGSSDKATFAEKNRTFDDNFKKNDAFYDDTVYAKSHVPRKPIEYSNHYESSIGDSLLDLLIKMRKSPEKMNRILSKAAAISNNASASANFQSLSQSDASGIINEISTISNVASEFDQFAHWADNNEEHEHVHSDVNLVDDNPFGYSKTSLAVGQDEGGTITDSQICFLDKLRNLTDEDAALKKSRVIWAAQTSTESVPAQTKPSRTMYSNEQLNQTSNLSLPDLNNSSKSSGSNISITKIHAPQPPTPLSVQAQDVIENKSKSQMMLRRSGSRILRNAECQPLVISQGAGKYWSEDDVVSRQRNLSFRIVNHDDTKMPSHEKLHAVKDQTPSTILKHVSPVSKNENIRHILKRAGPDDAEANEISENRLVESSSAKVEFRESLIINGIIQEASNKVDDTIHDLSTKTVQDEYVKLRKSSLVEETMEDSIESNSDDSRTSSKVEFRESPIINGIVQEASNKVDDTIQDLSTKIVQDDYVKHRKSSLVEETMEDSIKDSLVEGESYENEKERAKRRRSSSYTEDTVNKLPIRIKETDDTTNRVKDDLKKYSPELRISSIDESIKYTVQELPNKMDETNMDVPIGRPKDYLETQPTIFRKNFIDKGFNETLKELPPKIKEIDDIIKNLPKDTSSNESKDIFEKGSYISTNDAIDKKTTHDKTATLEAEVAKSKIDNFEIDAQTPQRKISNIIEQSSLESSLTKLIDGFEKRLAAYREKKSQTSQIATMRSQNSYNEKLKKADSILRALKSEIDQKLPVEETEKTYISFFEIPILEEAITITEDSDIELSDEENEMMLEKVPVKEQQPDTSNEMNLRKRKDSLDEKPISIEKKDIMEDLPVKDVSKKVLVTGEISVKEQPRDTSTEMKRKDSLNEKFVIIEKRDIIKDLPVKDVSEKVLVDPVTYNLKIKAVEMEPTVFDELPTRDTDEIPTKETEITFQPQLDIPLSFVEKNNAIIFEDKVLEDETKEIEEKISVLSTSRTSSSVSSYSSEHTPLDQEISNWLNEEMSSSLEKKKKILCSCCLKKPCACRWKKLDAIKEEDEVSSSRSSGSPTPSNHVPSTSDKLLTSEERKRALEKLSDNSMGNEHLGAGEPKCDFYPIHLKDLYKFTNIPQTFLAYPVTEEIVGDAPAIQHRCTCPSGPSRPSSAPSPTNQNNSSPPLPAPQPGDQPNNMGGPMQGLPQGFIYAIPCAMIQFPPGGGFPQMPGNTQQPQPQQSFSHVPSQMSQGYLTCGPTCPSYIARESLCQRYTCPVFLPLSSVPSGDTVDKLTTVSGEAELEATPEDVSVSLKISIDETSTVPETQSGSLVVSEAESKTESEKPEEEESESPVKSGTPSQVETLGSDKLEEEESESPVKSGTPSHVETLGSDKLADSLELIEEKSKSGTPSEVQEPTEDKEVSEIASKDESAHTEPSIAVSETKEPSEISPKDESVRTEPSVALSEGKEASEIASKDQSYHTDEPVSVITQPPSGVESPSEPGTTKTASKVSVESSKKSGRSSASKIPVPISPSKESATRSPTIVSTPSKPPSRHERGSKESLPKRPSPRESPKALSKEPPSRGSKTSECYAEQPISSFMPSSGEHPRNCDCTTCKCNPCKDQRKSPYKRPLTDDQATKDKTSEPKGPVCACQICRCITCIDPNKCKDGFDDQPGFAHGVPLGFTGKPCDCEDECTCNPCKDPQKFQPGFSSTRRQDEFFSAPTSMTKTDSPGIPAPPVDLPSIKSDTYDSAPLTPRVEEVDSGPTSSVPIAQTYNVSLPYVLDSVSESDGALPAYQTIGRGAEISDEIQRMQEPGATYEVKPGDTFSLTAAPTDTTGPADPTDSSIPAEMSGEIREEFIPPFQSTPIREETLEFGDSEVADSLLSYTRNAPVDYGDSTASDFQEVSRAEKADIFGMMKGMQEPGATPEPTPGPTDTTGPADSTAPSDTTGAIDTTDSSIPAEMSGEIREEFIPPFQSTPIREETLEFGDSEVADSLLSYTRNAPVDYGDSTASDFQEVSRAEKADIFGMMKGMQEPGATPEPTPGPTDTTGPADSTAPSDTTGAIDTTDSSIPAEMSGEIREEFIPPFQSTPIREETLEFGDSEVADSLLSYTRNAPVDYGDSTASDFKEVSRAEKADIFGMMKGMQEPGAPSEAECALPKQPCVSPTVMPGALACTCCICSKRLAHIEVKPANERPETRHLAHTENELIVPSTEKEEITSSSKELTEEELIASSAEEEPIVSSTEEEPIISGSKEVIPENAKDGVLDTETIIITEEPLVPITEKEQIISSTEQGPAVSGTEEEIAGKESYHSAEEFKPPLSSTPLSSTKQIEEKFGDSEIADSMLSFTRNPPEDYGTSTASDAEHGTEPRDLIEMAMGLQKDQADDSDNKIIDPMQSVGLKQVTIGGKTIDIQYADIKVDDRTVTVRPIHPVACSCPKCKCSMCVLLGKTSTKTTVDSSVADSSGPASTVASSAISESVASSNIRELNMTYVKPPDTGPLATKPIVSDRILFQKAGFTDDDDDISECNPDLCRCYYSNYSTEQASAASDATYKISKDPSPTRAIEPGQPDSTPTSYNNMQMVPHMVTCDCTECKCNPCAPGGIEDADLELENRLPPSLIGPSFIKSSNATTISSQRSAVPNSSSCGSSPSFRPVALREAEMSDLDTTTLKNRLLQLEKETKERVNEIMQLRKYIDNIQCMCSPIQTPSRPSTPTHSPYSSPATSTCNPPNQNTRPKDNTVAGLQCALSFLQGKCRNKDRMITELADELRHRADAQSFQNVLKNIAAERDITSSPCASRQVMRTPAEKPCAPKEGCHCINEGDLNVVGPSVAVDPAPLAISEVRKISNDSLLVKWERPNSSQIKGYEVEVNGEVKSRVHSATRTAAVLNGLQMDVKMTLTVYAVSVTGARCHPPARAVYQPRPATPTTQSCRC